MSFTGNNQNQYSLPAPPAYIDSATSARLIAISKKPFLSTKDIHLILNLGLPTGFRRIADIVARAESEQTEVAKLILREQSPVHKLLLKGSLLQDEDIRALAEMDVGQLQADDGFAFRLCTAARLYCTSSTPEEAPMSTADQNGAKRKADGSPKQDSEPVQMRVHDENALETFQVAVEEEEIGYRILAREAAREQGNLEAAQSLADLLPGEEVCDAILLGGVHDNFEAKFLLPLVKIIMHVRRLPYDEAQFAESVADTSAIVHTIGKYSSLMVRLSSPQTFKFGASPFCDAHPQSWISTDLEHESIPGIFSFGPLTFPTQAVCALPESWVRLDIAICRGLLDGDSFEISLGLLWLRPECALLGCMIDTAYVSSQKCVRLAAGRKTRVGRAQVLAVDGAHLAVRRQTLRKTNGSALRNFSFA